MVIFFVCLLECSKSSPLLLTWSNLIHFGYHWALSVLDLRDYLLPFPIVLNFFVLLGSEKHLFSPVPRHCLPTSLHPLGFLFWSPLDFSAEIRWPAVLLLTCPLCNNRTQPLICNLSLLCLKSIWISLRLARIFFKFVSRWERSSVCYPCIHVLRSRCTGIPRTRNFRSGLSQWILAPVFLHRYTSEGESTHAL